MQDANRASHLPLLVFVTCLNGNFHRRIPCNEVDMSEAHVSFWWGFLPAFDNV